MIDLNSFIKLTIAISKLMVHPMDTASCFR